MSLRASAIVPEKKLISSNAADPGRLALTLATREHGETICKTRLQPARSEALSQSFSGAGCRNRTRDPLITNQMLYQLS